MAMIFLLLPLPLPPPTAIATDPFLYFQPRRIEFVHITPRDAAELHKVYRDAWERRPTRKPSFYREPCVGNNIDYPDLDVPGEIDSLKDIWEKNQRR